MSSPGDATLGRKTFAAYWLDHKNWAGEELFTTDFARGVVEEFVDTWPKLGMATESLNRGRTKAGEKHVEPLEALLELFQNANDTGASWARLVLRQRDLLFVHNGRRVHMRDVPAIVMPYLTTKEHDTGSLGRFGIGLKTLTALGPTLEVHSHPYHFAAGVDGPEVARPHPAVNDVYDPKAEQTLFRLPLEPGVLAADDLLEWVDDLGVQGLVFLSNLRRLTVTAGGRSVELKVRLKKDTDHTDGVLGRVTERHLSGGGGWRVYSAEVTPPAELVPTDKDREATVTVSVALSNVADGGRICVGLPVERRVTMPMSINAPFDPDEARRDLRHTAWNDWLFGRVAELAAAAARIRFDQDPATLWRVVPLTAELDSEHQWLHDRLSEVRASVIEEIGAFTVQPPDPEEDLVTLAEVQYEPQWLDGLIPPEILTLRESAIVPQDVRDGAGRWRQVLRDAKLGSALQPNAALRVCACSDEELGDPSPGWWAALVAAYLKNNHGDALADAPVLVLADGRRVSPEDVDAGLVLTPAATVAPVPVLAAMHELFLAEPHGPRIERWLEKSKRLSREPTDERLLEALAAWGGEAHDLDDQAVVWLQRALWKLDDVHRDSIGSRVGGNVALDGYEYVDGKRRKARARPARSYLPASLSHQRDSFARAAGATPGLTWISARYDKVLRTSGERTNDGVVATLRLLGARVAPPLEERAEAADHRYTRSGVAYRRDTDAGELQSAAIKKLDGYDHHLLGDWGSPDLICVATDIAADRDRKRRRARSAALFATLSREWSRLYAERERVVAVTAYHGWNWEGRVPATWISKLAGIPWMSTGNGALAPPRRLALDTESLRAAHGAQLLYASGLDAGASHATELAEALGMRTRPSASGLVEELRHLRDVTDDHPPGAVAARWISLVRALALLCPKVDDDPPLPRQPVDDTTVQKLRAAFGTSTQKAGLVFDGRHWRSAAAAVVGSGALGRFRVALAGDAPLDRLWRVLGIEHPTIETCVDVLADLSAAPLADEDAGTYVSTLRLAARLLQADEPHSDLTRAPILCRDGWVRRRPIYAVVDHGLAAKIAEHALVWDARCNIESLGGLPEALGVTVLAPRDFTVTGVAPSEYAHGESWRPRYELAVRHLKNSCAIHYPGLYDALAASWEELAGATLAVSPTLAAEVRLDDTQAAIDVDALAVLSPPTLAVRTESMFGSDDLGFAIAAAWLPSEVDAEVPHKTVAMLWREAWQAAKEERVAPVLELPTSAVDVLGGLKGAIEARDLPAPKKRAAQTSDATPTDEGTDLAVVALKDPSNLAVSGIAVVEAPASSAPSAPGSAVLEDGERLRAGGGQAGSGKPRRVRAPSHDPEQIAMEILRTALRADRDDIRDFRSRRGIGADAVDADLGFIELKGYQGPMPSSVTLTRDEAKRAMDEGDDYVLAVVAGLRAGEMTVVKLFPNPMAALEPRPSSSISLHGVDRVEGIEITLEDRPADSEG